MEIVDSFYQIIQPGLWFVKSRQPIVDVSRFVYEIGVELGQPLTVLSSARKVIQDEVVALIKRNYLDSISDNLERDWLEQELSEYYTHGFFWYPEELNVYSPNGSFWSNYVQFDADGWLSLSNCSYNIILVENPSALWWEDETEISRILPLVEEDAKEKEKTIFVFVSPNFLNLCP